MCECDDVVFPRDVLAVSGTVLPTPGGRAWTPTTVDGILRAVRGTRERRPDALVFPDAYVGAAVVVPAGAGTRPAGAARPTAQRPGGDRPPVGTGGARGGARRAAIVVPTGGGRRDPNRIAPVRPARDPNGGGVMVIAPGQSPASLPIDSAEDAQWFAEVSELLGILEGMDQASLDQTIAENPWILELLQATAGGSTTVSGTVDDVRQADYVFSAIWDTVKPFVPYGNIVDIAHQARRGVMDREVYGRGREPSPLPPDRVGRPPAESLSVGELVRRRRSGDPWAIREVARLKREGGAVWREYQAAALAATAE